MSPLLRALYDTTRNAYRRRKNENWFVGRALDHADRKRRAEILRRFRLVDRHVPRAHTELDILLMAD